MEKIKAFLKWIMAKIKRIEDPASTPAVKPHIHKWIIDENPIGLFRGTALYFICADCKATGKRNEGDPEVTEIQLPG